MEEFNPEETRIADKIRCFKKASGTHSPSNLTLLKYIPELSIKIDACFLSNPYATDLFLSYFEEEIITKGKFRDLIEFYPSQNRVIAKPLAEHIEINADNLIIGNGAIEIIQAVLHNFVKGKMMLSIPTFSSYYEFINQSTQIVYNPLSKAENFKFDVEKFVKKARNEKIDSIVIINPNNPDGGYIVQSDIIYICDQLQHLDNIIIDESFIHFAFENTEYRVMSVAGLIEKYNNLIIIKSMSKDFGIAGLRAGYGVMAKNKVDSLLKNGFLWNSSGLSEYFFNLYVRMDFNREYEKVRKKYLQITNEFLLTMQSIRGIKVFPSKANFALLELLTGITSGDAAMKLLVSHGINVRDCSDKIGLNGQFIRIASRKQNENEYISKVFQTILLENAVLCI